MGRHSSLIQDQEIISVGRCQLQMMQHCQDPDPGRHPLSHHLETGVLMSQIKR